MRNLRERLEALEYDLAQVGDEVEDNERAATCLRKELDALTNTVGKAENIAIANAGRIVSLTERHNKLDEKVCKMAQHIVGYDNRDNAIIKKLTNRLDDVEYAERKNMSAVNKCIASLSNQVTDLKNSQEDYGDLDTIAELESRIEDLEHEAKYGSIPTVAIPIGSTGIARVVTINDIDMSVKVLEEQMLLRRRREECANAEIADLKGLLSDTRHTIAKHENRITYLERDTAVNRELLKRLISPPRFEKFLECADETVYLRMNPDVSIRRRDEDEYEDD